MQENRVNSLLQWQLEVTAWFLRIYLPLQRLAFSCFLTDMTMPGTVSGMDLTHSEPGQTDSPATLRIPSRLVPQLLSSNSQYHLADSDVHRVAQAVAQIIGTSQTHTNPIAVDSSTGRASQSSKG